MEEGRDKQTSKQACERMIKRIVSTERKDSPIIILGQAQQLRQSCTFGTIIQDFREYVQSTQRETV